MFLRLFWVFVLQTSATCYGVVFEWVECRPFKFLGVSLEGILEEDGAVHTYRCISCMTQFSNCRGVLFFTSVDILVSTRCLDD